MLAHRSREKEIMDDLDISGPVIAPTLKELDIINKWLGGNAITLSVYKKMIRSHEVKHVADLGCGSGYILQQMSRISRKQKKEIRFTGIDANPHIVEYARAHTGQQDITIEHGNIFDPEFAERKFDIIHCCLFLHHFTHEELVWLFRSFSRQAGVGIIVNDLHRHFLAYHSIRLITRFFSNSYMVRNDAKVSVARGFKKDELKAILAEAGISDYSLKWKWAFRWQLVIYT